MTRKARPRRKTSTVLKPKPPHTVPTFVVYVTFPSGVKEYSYLCNLPHVGQGSVLMANGAEVTVRRTGMFDNNATKWVHPLPDYHTVRREARMKAILVELADVERLQIQTERWQALARKNPSARKLINEYAKLQKQSTN